MMLRIAVVGTRTFQDYAFLSKKLDDLRFILGDFQVKSGGADGADTLGIRWANERGLPFPEVIPAEWSNLSMPDAVIKTRANGTKYDALAGLRRNMILVEEVDAVVAFWNGKSKGTLDFLRRAWAKRLPTLTWYPERTPHYSDIDKLGIKGLR